MLATTYYLLPTTYCLLLLKTTDLLTIGLRVQELWCNEYYFWMMRPWVHYFSDSLALT